MTTMTCSPTTGDAFRQVLLPESLLSLYNLAGGKARRPALNLSAPNSGPSPMEGNQVPLQGGIWLVLSLAGPLAFSISLLGALRRAYEMSACTGSFWQAPSAIQKVGSDEYLSARDIV